MKTPGYHSQINADFLKLIPPDAKAVMEVGCGTGALAVAYRRINPRVRYLGIEKEPEAARLAIASGCIDHVFTDDAAVAEPVDFGLSEAHPAVDCLVFGDALEHMVDPWAVLAKLARWVRAGGQILACVPNVQHYSVLVNLMRGKWEYQNEGLLNRTHLRFFTLQTVIELFTAAGLDVFDVQPRWWPSTDFERFQQVMAPVLQSLAIDPATFATQTRAVQYIVRATRGAPPPQRMLIWSVLGSRIGSHVRVGEPNEFLTTIPGVRTITSTAVQFDDLDRTWPGEEKIFLQQRVVIPLADHLRLQRALLARGYLIVGEFDDDPQHFAELVRTKFFALRSCHCLQTTTEVMADTLRAFNPHVAVFPNQVATLSPPKPKRDDQDSRGPVTVFFGALNRTADWAPLLPSLNRVIEALGEQVRLQVIYDRAFFDALSTSRKMFEPLCSYERYHELLHTADIALLPLERNRFNMHKSDLKFIECAAHAVVALASPTVYGHTIVHGETGLTYQSPDEFAILLECLVLDVAMRQRLAANAYRYVTQKRLLSTHFRARHEWYRRMFECRLTLEVELRGRAPELTGP